MGPVVSQAGTSAMKRYAKELTLRIKHFSLSTVEPELEYFVIVLVLAQPTLPADK